MFGECDDPNVLSWDEFLAKGDTVTDEALQAAIDAQDPDDVCTLIYTSGTTGNPKAVMISHDNITWTSRTAIHEFGGDSNDRVLSYLPLSHVAEQAISHTIRLLR